MKTIATLVVLIAAASCPVSVSNAADTKPLPTKPKIVKEDPSVILDIKAYVGEGYKVAFVENHTDQLILTRNINGKLQSLITCPPAATLGKMKRDGTHAYSATIEQGSGDGKVISILISLDGKVFDGYKETPSVALNKIGSGKTASIPTIKPGTIGNTRSS